MRYLILILVPVLVRCAPRTVVISGERGSELVEQQRFETESQEIEVIGEGRGFMPSKLVTVTLIKEEMVNGFLKLHLGFKSKSNDFKTMQYLVTYFNEDGMPLEKYNVGWLPVSINPRSFTYQEVMAKTVEAKTYKVHIRKLKNIDPY